ncbi:ATP-binding cassette, subfamily B [Micromonospora purpureochromogenes]|uniref:ATP-binding cassette, subfamily B n=1 Tax=Micromonospora purpureochromogenes TaxID=47872 RepID=A0A1C4U7Z0_9ACTN|nr:ABC transporter ATP-binding protein [Micromonospora purpureochromogenes]SCE67774.1 ATP-binding cassette, subfamily B [Micromonospora purpureochromogenes]
MTERPDADGAELPPRTHLALAGQALRLGWAASPAACLAGLGVMALSGLTPAASAWASKLLVDGLTGARTAHAGGLVMIAGLTLALGGIGTVLGYLASLATAAQQRAIALRVESELYGAVNRLPGLARFEDPDFQDRLRLAEQSAAAAPSSVSGFLLAIVRVMVVTTGFLGVVATVWWPMAVLLLIVGAASVWAQFALAREQAGVTEATMAMHRRRFSYQSLLTNLAAVKEIRLYGLGGLFHDRMVAGLRETSGRELRMEQRAALTQSGYALVGTALAAAGAMAVVYRAATGSLSAGDVVLFVAAVVGVQGAFGGTVSQLASAAREVRLFRHYRAVVGAEPDLADGSRVPPPLSDAIEFHDVWFRYHPSGDWVLRGVDLRIPVGQALGVVGANGAGKSTVIKLLCRFYDPERGRITWDGTDLREFRVADLRRRMGATFQDYMTYELTAGENVGVGDVDRLTELPAVVRAATLAEADEFVRALPRGYDTLVSRLFFEGAIREQGVTLSGGQGQRLALARSLMRTGADLLILDEPSSGLDALAEHRIHHTVREHRQGRTSLLVSHRLSGLRDADLIVVLDGGRVAERGTHDELMAAGGGYATMFTTQAAGYQDERVPVPSPLFPGAVPVRRARRDGRPLDLAPPASMMVVEAEAVGLPRTSGDG